MFKKIKQQSKSNCICNKCSFYELDSFSIEFYDNTIFEAYNTTFENIISTSISMNGFIVASNNVTILLHDCTVNDNEESPINFIRMIDSNNSNNNYAISIINSEFKWWRNSDIGAEGSILHLTPNGTVNIYSSDITHSNSFNGGVIFAHDCTINITDCDISYNEADNNGGVIYMVRGNILLQSVRFYYNTADNNGGVLDVWNANVIANDVNWTKNTATDYGSSIMASSSIFNIENSQWIANQGAASTALQCYDCIFNCIHCKFENNIGIDGFGGLTYIHSTEIMLRHVEIINSSADIITADNLVTSMDNAFGGSLYAVDSYLYMNNVSISGGMVNGFGGCMYGWNSKFEIINSFFDKNKADIGGGVLYIGNSTLNISNSEIMNNESPYGSCIYAYNSSLILLNNILKYNVADGLGGCLFVNASYLQLLDCDASYNYAPNGNGSVLQIVGIDKLINNNNIDTESIIDVNDCQFVNNTALSGGVIFINVKNNIYPKIIQHSDFEPSVSELCDDNTLCYSENVTVRSNEFAADRSGKRTMFNVTFNIMNDDCINPMITIDYEPIDYEDKHIEVYGNNINIGSCGGVNNQCNTFANCLNDYKLGVNNILTDTQYTISMTQSETVQAKCFQYHKLSINTYLELTYNIEINSLCFDFYFEYKQDCIIHLIDYDLWGTLTQMNVKTFLCNQFSDDTIRWFTAYDSVQATFRNKHMYSSWDTERIATSKFRELKRFTIQLDIQLIDVFVDNKYCITNRFLSNEFVNKLKKDKKNMEYIIQLEMNELDYFVSNLNASNGNYKSVDECEINECKIENKKQEFELKKWFFDEVKMPKYYEMFVDIGITELNMIKVLNEHDLIQIGVYNSTDIAKFMIDIAILNVRFSS